MANPLLKKMAQMKPSTTGTIKRAGTPVLGNKSMTGGAVLNTANKAATPLAGQKSLNGGNTLNTPKAKTGIVAKKALSKPVNSALANQMRNIASKIHAKKPTDIKTSTIKPVSTKTTVSGATVAKLKSGGLGKPKVTVNKASRKTAKMGNSSGNLKVKVKETRLKSNVVKSPLGVTMNGNPLAPKGTTSKESTTLKNDKLKKAADSGEKLGYNPKSGTVSPQVKGNKYSKDPYIRNAQKQKKENYKVYNTLVKKAQSQKNYADRNTNNTYNALNKSAYSSYMNNVKSRNQIAQNSGMTGGAAERLRVGAETNLNRNYATSEGMRVSSLASNKQSFNNKKADALASYQSKNNTAFATARDQSLKAKKEKEAIKREEANRNLDVYSKTVTGFDTTKKADAEIARLRKSNDPNKDSKIRYVKAQKAAIRAQEKAYKEQAKQTGVSVSRKEAMKEAGGKKAASKKTSKKTSKKKASKKGKSVLK